jgi:hypothetical protein
MVGFVSALGAFGAAFAAIGKTGESWWLATPILVAPLLTVFAGLIPRCRPYRWWVLGISLFLSVLLVCIFLIPSSVRGDSGLWLGELSRHFLALMAKLKSSDVSTIVVAIVTYLMALISGTVAAAPKGAGKSSE